MFAVNLPDPVLVTRQSQLAKLVEKLLQQPIIAVDTEANSLYAYHERVCLIQFSIPGEDYLVDPIELRDLSALSEIFRNPNIEKIFHAAEYDLLMLGCDFKFDFAGIFDTMLAARILGKKAVGLGSILKSQFGVSVNKKYQRANWGRRPLPPEMLTYAQLDTHYLIEVRNRFKDALEKKDLWELAQEDFNRIANVDPSNHHNKPIDCWRINGSRKLKPKQIAILYQLCIYRDKKAQSLDRPLFKVITDQALVNIAIAQPKTLSDLEKVHNFSNRQVRWLGKEVLNAVHQGLNETPPKPPRRPRHSEQYLARKDQLRSWRKRAARAMGVESDVVMPKDILYELAEKNPKTQQQLKKIMHAVPWRFDHFGDEIFDLLRASN